VVDGFFVYSDGNGIHAIDIATGAERWKEDVKAYELLAVGHDVYALAPVGEVLHLRSFDAGTGLGLTDDKLPGPNPDSFAPHLAVAPGLLLVATHAKVIAYESYFKPAADGIRMGYGGQEAVAGGKVFLGGVLGTRMRASKPAITFESAGWRGGTFRAFFHAPPTRDGGFAITTKIDRNVRLRAHLGNAVSNVITAYAWPRVAYGKPHAAGRTHISIGMTVRSPGVSIKGQTLVMYFVRGRSRHYTRLGSGRLRGAGKGGRTRTTITFKGVNRASDDDYLVVCLPRGLKLGLGRPSKLTRSCGARTIKG
jgi:hypothetical protein